MSEENILVEEELRQDAAAQDAQAPQEQMQEVPAQTAPTADLQPQEEAEETNEVDQEEQQIAEKPAVSTTAAVAASEKPYHERYYLKYREGKRSDALDLSGTRVLLQELGFDGGELRQARERKNCAENLLHAGRGKSNQMYCSYCGAEISGVEFHRLPDGRLRCTTCSNTIVTSREEVEELCQRVIANLDNFFGAAIDVPISFEITEERRLKKKVGVPLGTRDGQSMLILGVAINKKGKYKIILENGAPRISLIATFAHELTHIWQYTHWDNNSGIPKCSGKKRLLIYEGMAKWVELQYLYLIGETNVAKREEYITRNRKDEYGIGFCLYDNQYPLSRGSMTCEETPFTSDRYPLE